MRAGRRPITPSMNGSQPQPERRQGQRVDLTSRLAGQIVTLDEPVVVEQLAQGGMTLATRIPLAPHVLHEFRIWDGDTPFFISWRVTSSRIQLSGDDVTYRTGVVFADPDDEARHAVLALMNTPPRARTR